MTYACANIIYGIDLTDVAAGDDSGLRAAIDDALDRNLVDCFYSGYRPHWVGVELCSFDVCGNFRAAELKTTPTDEQARQARQKIEALKQAYPVLSEALSVEPDAWVVWGTS